MTLYELGFILLFLGSVTSVLFSAFVRKTGGTRKILVALASAWGIYLVVLVVSDVHRPQRVFKVGEEQCFDEMCFAVTDVQTEAEQGVSPSDTTAKRLYVIKIRVTSHSRGRSQAENGLRARLYDGGTFVDVSEEAQKAYDGQHGESPKLTQRIDPKERILCVLVFEVPRAIAHPALTLNHGFNPGYLVIGESPFFHKPDVHLLFKDR